MKYAIIENGKVSNIVLSETVLEVNWVEAKNANIGDLWDGVEFSSPTEDTAELEKQIRAMRNGMLQICDWVVIKSSESGYPVPTEWAIYRQSLRDVPQQPGFPQNVVWPQPPA